MLEMLIMNKTLTEQERAIFTINCLHNIAQANKSNIFYLHKNILFLDESCQIPVCGMISMGLSLTFLTDSQLKIIIISK